MLSTFADHELEMDYEIKCREPHAASAGRERCSQDRFHTKSRYSRTSKGGPTSGAHRRRAKRSQV